MSNTTISESYSAFKGYYTRDGFLGYVQSEKKFILFPSYEKYEEYLAESESEKHSE